MADIFDRLQLVNHEEIFATREEAVNYVLGLQTIDRPALLAEPMILLYESEDATKGPNVILAIGSVGDGSTPNTANRTFFIDTQKTEEEIEDLRELIEEAIKSLTIVPLTSDTINMFAEKTEDGTFLSGDVKIADYRIVSGKVEENIIETEGEKGIYAFVDMEYDPDTFVITFRTTKVSKEFQLPKDQHVEKGWYDVRDESIHLKLADGTIVPILLTNLIEEWTVLGEASNTPLVLIKEHVSAITEGHEGIYDWQDVLSGDVRVASHINDNILQKDRTGRYLYVKGTADNIKYKEGMTVKEALDNVDCKVSTSTGNLIYKRPDGIYATAMVGYNTAENKLTYTYSEGNTGELKTVEFQLNSVKLLEDITYDPVNEMIVIRYIDAQGEYQRVEIPVHDIIEEWDVNNEGHNIKLNKFRSQGQGKDILTADAKIHEGDNNILEDLNHELYVKGVSSNIKYDITGDTTVKDVLDSLSGVTDGIQDEIDRIDATIGSGFTSDPHENITAKFEQLNEKIESEIERSTEKDSELEAKIDAEIERSTEKDTEHDGKIQAIETTIGSGFSTDAHETVTYKFEQLQNQVNDVDGNLQNEIDRSIEKDNEHDGKIQSIEDEIGDGFGPRNTVRDEIDNLQSEIESISADSASSIKDIINIDESINVDKTDPVRPIISVNLSEEVEHGKENVIKFNADGLYAGVDLSYIEEANKLIFSTTNGSKEIELKSMSSIISIEYNPSKEAIVITYMTNGHEIKTVEIPVGDLIDEWRVEDGHPHAVALEKVRVSGGTVGQDVLKASVVITDGHDDNILVMDDGALYVPGGQIEQNKQDIAGLKARMTAAEGDIDNLEDGLASEISRSTSADVTLDEKINQEISDRIVDVNAEETRAKAAESALSENLQNEIARATSEEQRIETKIDSEITRSTAKDQELTNAISTETNRATSAETALQTAINNEVTRATNAEANLRNDLTTTQASLQNEITRATSEEQRIESKIDNEIARSTAKDQELANAISAEATRAASAETVLQTAISNEVTRATNAETNLRNDLTTTQTSLQNEINRATSEEQRIEAKIDSEVARSTAKDQDLTNAISAEATRATSAETTLQTAISNEVTRATNAESTLNTAITNEISRATAKDSALETKDNEIIAALQQEITNRQEGDTELAEAIRDSKLTFEDTDSIDFNNPYNENNTVKANVKLQDGDNIIKLGSGLYASVNLSYDPARNTIKLVTSNGEQEAIQLNTVGSLIDGIEYDSVNRALVIKYHDAAGNPLSTSFPVNELFNDWIVQNPAEKSAVELTKVINSGDTADVLSGRILITDDHNGDGKPDQGSDNIIEIRNNGLYVNGSAISGAAETAECVKNELKAVERAIIGHIVGEECGSGYTYEKNTLATYINNAISFYDADFILDQNIKRVENYVDVVSASTDCVDSKANKMYELLYGSGSTMVDCGSSTVYRPHNNSCIISAATSFDEADQLLNDTICQMMSMWESGETCTAEAYWEEENGQNKFQVDAKLSRGRAGSMTDNDIITTTTEGAYIDPTTNEFTDTNALRIVCLPNGVTLKQNGIYLSNVWDCGLYYGASDSSAKAKAEAAGYNTDYSTDESPSASNINYMNNVR